MSLSRKTAITRLIKITQLDALEFCGKLCLCVRKMSVLADEVDLRAVWDDAPVIAHLEEFLDGFAAVWAVVECALVDVHADKAVGERGVEVARELHRVLERLFAMVEGVLDAVAQGVGGGEEGVGAEGPADGVSTEREREVGLFAPPLAEVEELEQAVIRVGELALVDDEAGLVFAGDYGGDDLVEGDHHGFDLRCEELEREVGGGEGAGDGDACFF